MAPFTFHRLTLNDGNGQKRRFWPFPAMLKPLAGLRADGIYARLAAPMDGYGLVIEPGSDEAGGAFRVFLDRAGSPRPYSACVYCAAEPAAEARFDEAVGACRRAATDGRLAGMPPLLKRPRRTPWLATLGLADGPAEAPLLEDAVFMTLAAGPRRGAGSSRALRGRP